MIPQIPSFHQTLLSAIMAVEKNLNDRQIVSAENWQESFSFGGVPYGTNKEVHFEIASIKGKATKKFGHVTIWRMDSGNYEVNFYLL